MGDGPILRAQAQSRGATLSPCGRYRYRLWRSWEVGPTVAWVMLNPSTADAEQDDPTIRKCIGFACRWGFAGIVVVNLFAFRATDPRDLIAVKCDRVGPDNDAAIIDACTGADRVFAAWGAQDRYPIRTRADYVCTLLRHLTLWSLGTAQSGAPLHPLMPSYGTEPRIWCPKNGDA